MSVRDSTEKNRWIVVSLALVALGIGLYLIFDPAPQGSPVYHYYYDLNTGKLVVSLGNEAPETKAHLVDAVAVSCGSCDEARSITVGYIKRIDPGARVHRLGLPGGHNGTGAGRVEPGTEGQNIQVAKAEASPAWLASGSDDGQQLVAQAMKCPDGRDAMICTAPRKPTASAP